MIMQRPSDTKTTQGSNINIGGANNRPEEINENEYVPTENEAQGINLMSYELKAKKETLGQILKSKLVGGVSRILETTIYNREGSYGDKRKLNREQILFAPQGYALHQ